MTYLAAETWQDAAITAWRAGLPSAPPTNFEIVLVDDADRAANKERFRLELSSQVSQLSRAGTQVVLGATRAFDGLRNAESARLRPPSHDSLALLLQTRAAQKSIPLTARLAGTLAASARNCVELESILQRCELLRSIGGDLRPEVILKPQLQLRETA